MPASHNPHDRFVKRIFSDREAAEAELRQVLPARLCESLDWSGLRVEPGSFVDPALSPRASDLLYSIPLSDHPGSVSVYVLLEHQSTIDPLMAVRFLIYIARIYERLLRDNDITTSIPLVVPLLLYQGPTGWTAARSLASLLDLPAPLRATLDPPVALTFAIDDLARSCVPDSASAQRLRQQRGAVVAEMARTLLWLYHHPEAARSQRAARLAQLGRAIVETLGVDAMEPFFAYFVATFAIDSPVRAIIVESASEETRELYTTIREEWLSQGKAEGLSQGLSRGLSQGVIQGQARALQQLLKTRGLPLSAAAEARIAACTDAEVIERWFVRAVTAETLDEVFDD